jgi:spermidine synthase
VEFVKTRTNYYDVIIVDSTDPAGPGEPLFNADFYQGMRQAMRHDGIITSQSESVFLHPKIVTRLLGITKKLFAVSGYALIHVPTYPGGNIGACVGSLKWDIRQPARHPDSKTAKVLKYYSAAVHQAAFVLPEFTERLIAEC